MTEELLETILNNSEFTECINDAAQHKSRFFKTISLR